MPSSTYLFFYHSSNFCSNMIKLVKSFNNAGLREVIVLIFAPAYDLKSNLKFAVIEFCSLCMPCIHGR